MALLQPVSFVSAVASSPEQLKNVAAIVAKYGGEAQGASFLAACENHDYNAANDILEQTVKELTGYDSPLLALGAFADQFPQLPGFRDKVANAFSEADRVKAIDDYRSQIIAIIEGKP